MLDIKTKVIAQKRQTFANVARRLGADRPASRYEEATYDLQPQINFHYRPTWDPAHELFDKGRTAIAMRDWDALKDPRQYYYGAYTIHRGRMMEAVEVNFSSVEKNALLSLIEPAWQAKIRFFLLPLRHAEWGANMNACSIVDQGSGTALTQAAMYATMDRLGIAQIISRLGLALGGPTALDEAKEVWMEAPAWQDMRRLVEDTLVLEDWFELYLAQFFCLDGLLYSFLFDHFEPEGQKHGAASVSMILQFMRDWHRETSGWTDAVLKQVVAESDENRTLLSRWQAKWSKRALAAVLPLASGTLPDAAAAVAACSDGLTKRAARLGLA